MYVGREPTNGTIRRKKHYSIAKKLPAHVVSSKDTAAAITNDPNPPNTALIAIPPNTLPVQGHQWHHQHGVMAAVPPTDNPLNNNEQQ